MTSTIVGVLELASKYRFGLTSRGTPMYLFRPYDDTQPDYIVGCSERDLTRNQIAIVRPASDNAAPTTKPRAHLERLLGPVGNPDAERAALLEHYCPTHPSRTAELPTPDTSIDDSRMEISAASGWTAFHVDPPGCRDVDDAIAWNPTTRNWSITIADADAATNDPRIRTAARQIAQTFYDLDGRVVRPMLPPAISEDIASLLPGQRRRGLSLVWEHGRPDTQLFVPSWITVTHGFTYESFADSAVAASLPTPVDDPHTWIAELMIRYNVAAARLLKAHGVGLLRTQAESDAVWADVPVLQFLAAKAALYVPATASDTAHATLELDAYCHATSPLRRFADLENQRCLKAILSGSHTDTHTDDTHTPNPLAAALNDRQKANRRWMRDLTFLEQVTPGRRHRVPVIWFSPDRVWVPTWRRLLRLRHTPTEPVPAPGTHDVIQIFCDPTRRNWKQRVLTAPANFGDEQQGDGPESA